MATAVLHCSGISEERRAQSTAATDLAVAQMHEGNDRQAIVGLERAIQLNPDNANAHLYLGQILGAREYYDRAEPHLRRAAALLEREVAEDPSRAASLGEARNALAAALTNLGRAAEALRVLRDVIGDVHYGPQHLALGNAGAAYLALRRYREAAEHLERAVALRSDFCVGQYRLGEAYLRLGEHGRAVEALDRALNNPAPGCAAIQPAWRARGEAHARLHHPDQARADFTRCREMSPTTRDGQECARMLRTAEAP